MKLSAVLHAVSLAIALCVQTMSSPIAGAWLFFHFAGCACSYRYPDKRPVIWWLALAWLVVLGASTFILMPVVNGAATMWVLAAMPMLALSVRQENIKAYLDAFLAVLVIYACGLIWQMIMHIQFTSYNYSGYAWPMLDPNNASAVINAGLIPSFYMALRKPKWFLPFAIFALAMLATNSKAGALAGGLSCAILIYEYCGDIPILLSLLCGLPFVPRIIDLCTKSIDDRLPIWKASLPLLTIHPFTGLGLGSFGYYYSQVRTENYTGGWFAHNDALQLGIEVGLPAALILVSLFFMVMKTTNRNNIPSMCVLLAIFLQSLVEFQFYVPAVSLVAGLGLAYHIRLQKEAI